MLSVDQKPQQESSEEHHQAMVASFIAGDMGGFKYVYSLYRQRVFSYCLYYMGNQTLAEDAFQEVFSRAYTRREQLREVKALKSWLLLVTRSVCLNLLRTSKFQPEFTSLSSYDSSGETSWEPKELAVHGADEIVADDMLKQALARLAPMYRDAFLLREFQGYEYEEIAEMTSTSVMNVKVRITRAKKRLRMLLAPYYSELNKTRKPSKLKLVQNSEDTDDSPDAIEADQTDENFGQFGEAYAV